MFIKHKRHFINMNSIPVEPSFSSSPNPKIAPIVIAGAAFVGRAVAGGVIGGAASWGANRILDNRFPARK
jgi:hypothetical protein